MFGKLLSKWAAWAIEGLKSSRDTNSSVIRLVELGPGRGSLMSALLKELPANLRDSVEVHMVEISPILRETQASALGIEHIEEVSSFVVSGDEISPPTTFMQPFCGGFVVLKAKQDTSAMEVSNLWRSKEKVKAWTGVHEDTGIKVIWHEHVSQIPAGPIVVVANEFFDALPTHQFKHEGGNWHEVVVDIDEGDKLSLSNEQCTEDNEVEITTNQVSVLDGQSFEFCPEGIACVQHIAGMMARFGGAALVIDYGMEEPIDTIRSISRKRGSKKDRPLSVLELPGEVDMTADVHFGALLHSFSSSSDEINVHPLQPQAYLLTELMGENIQGYLGVMRGGFREDMTDEEKDIFHLGPLVDRENMGSHFKCISASSSDLGKPIGWNLKEVLEQMEKIMSAQGQQPPRQ